MGLKRKKPQQTASKVLRNADDIVATKLEDDVHEELVRLGMIWSGVLDLNQPIDAADVAAMLSSYELLMATRFVDSEQHWTNAASFAAIGAFCEQPTTSIDPLIEDHFDEDVPKNPIGFSSVRTTSPHD